MILYWKFMTRLILLFLVLSFSSCAIFKGGNKDEKKETKTETKVQKDTVSHQISEDLDNYTIRIKVDDTREARISDSKGFTKTFSGAEYIELQREIKSLKNDLNASNQNEEEKQEEKEEVKEDFWKTKIDLSNIVITGGILLLLYVLFKSKPNSFLF